MLVRCINHKWLKALVALLLPAMLMIVALVYTGRAADFSSKLNLATTSYLSGLPQIEAAGGLVVALWSDGYNANADTKNWGHIYLRAATESEGWKVPSKVMAATNDVWGVEPRFTFDNNGTTVHVVWAQTGGCGGSLSNCSGGSIEYTSCDVSNGVVNCSTSSATIASTANDLAYRTPDIVQDDDGDLHVVWSDTSGKELLYSRCAANCTTSGNWSTPTTVPGSNTSQGANPRLAFSNNVIHLVWDGEADNQIYYRRDTNDDNNSFASNGTTWNSTQWDANYINPGNPTIAVAGNLLYIAWDVQKSGSTTDYILAFVASPNNGTTFTSPKNVTSNNTTFTNRTSNDQEFTGGLKPSLAITSSTAPVHLVWHEKPATGGEGVANVYQVFYSSLITYTSGTWSTPVTVTTSYGSAPTPTPTVGGGGIESSNVSPQGIGADSVEPDLALGQGVHVHISYMEKVGGEWDIFYQGVISQTTSGSIYLPILMRNY